MELGQETMQSRNEVLQFFVNYETPWRPSKKCKQTNEHQIFNLTAAVSKSSQLLSASFRMNTSYEVLPGKKPISHRAVFLTIYWAALPEA